MFTGRILRPARIGAAATLLLAAGLTGCVSQERYNDTQQANRTLTARNQELVAEIEQLRTTNSALSSEGGARDTVVADLIASNDQLKAQLARSQDALRRFNQRMGDLAMGPLDPATDAALAQLAASSPMMDYDADRGMIRFSSDMTFASGSDEVSANAEAALSGLANVLNTRQGLEYEIMIVGHTDNVKPSSATQRFHRTNMHLAVHRAIAVRSELQGLGVPPERMFAAGWGEYRPIIPNNARGGTAENRRVELFLMRPTGDTQLSSAVTQQEPPADAATTRAPGAGVEPVK